MDDKKVKRPKMPESLKKIVLERDSYTCQLCGMSREHDGSILHIDHIYPVVHGGKNELSNLQTLCRDCNVGKSDLILELEP